MSRPKVNSCRIDIRVPPQVQASLLLQAAQAEMPLAVYVRHVLLQGMIQDGQMPADIAASLGITLREASSEWILRALQAKEQK